MGEVWRMITPFSLIHIYPLSSKQQTRILFVKRKGLQMVLEIYNFCLKNRNTNKTHLVRIDIYSGLHQKVTNLLNCVQLHKVKVTVLKSTTPKNRSYPKFELSFLWGNDLSLAQWWNIVPTPNRTHLIIYFVTSSNETVFFKIMQIMAPSRIHNKMNQISSCVKLTLNVTPYA